MNHVLDRPVWNALTTRQASFARGGGHALRFDPQVGLFAATRDGSAEGVLPLIPSGGGVALVEIGEMAPPPGALVMQRAVLEQMIAPAITPGKAKFEIVPLGDGDAAEMLALATLTEPGPFFRRTHQLGDFIGVKQNGKLVAMAGERMKPQGFTEVSGVCTHPEHRGRGYAGGLMRIVAQRILARGETPFLHVYAHNAGAIALYEALGFHRRTAMHMTVLARSS
ncbi:MAG TPA: GNAT family N-acetyltransferase [Rhizomicrobium sp.]|nr:GNAT family N-acetyltransferase [Rhizomicrobium sp.]